MSYKKYVEVKEECSDEFEFIRFGDLCDMKAGITCGLVHAYSKDNNGCQLIRIQNLMVILIL